MTTLASRYVGSNNYAVSTGSGSTPLPAGLFLHPGTYVFNGVALDCSVDGYYYFWNPLASGPASRRIVYSGDIPTLMSSITHANGIGSQDDALTISQITNADTTQEARLLCGFTALWSKAICDSLGGVGFPAVQSRVVHALAADAPGGYFDGHSLKEVKNGTSWQLHDVAAGCDFGGLSLKDVCPASSITIGIRKPVAIGTSSGFDCEAWQKIDMPNDAAFQSAFARVMQIPGWEWAGGTINGIYYPAGIYFLLTAATIGRKSWVEGLGYKTTTDASLIDAMFYS